MLSKIETLAGFRRAFSFQRVLKARSRGRAERPGAQTEPTCSGPMPARRGEVRPARRDFLSRSSGRPGSFAPNWP